MMDLDALLRACIERGASDVHLKPDAPPILRVHGRLEPQSDWDVVTAEFMDQTARRMLDERLYGQLREGREIDVGYDVAGVGRFRVNLFMSLGAIRAVMRAIPSVKPGFEELGLPPVVAHLAMERRGLILVTGVAGSGKSTTLAAMVDHMNRHRKHHIITIEDPIEFAHEDVGCSISQREVGSDTASFSVALRAALREDPDVIMVGEMRDVETMAVALHAAETGHLVLSTLHTLDATETINRIVANFPRYQDQQIRDQLAAVVQGVVSQRLIPRASGDGRVPAVEILLGTAVIRDCIRDAKRTPEIPLFIAQGTTPYGMQTFDQCLFALYRDGVVSYETARDSASSPDDFDLKVRGIFSGGDLSTVKAPEKAAAAAKRASPFARP
jgi:twitching motility protein PilT